MRRSERVARLALAALEQGMPWSTLGSSGRAMCSSMAPQHRSMNSENSCVWKGSMWTHSRMFSSLPSHTKMGMPALSPTMSQGTLVEWKVTEGQEVAAGDLLAEVETDKATLGWENQDDGVIARLLVPDGTQGIDVGQIVAIMVENKEDVAAFTDYRVNSEAGGEPAAVSEESQEQAGGVRGGDAHARASPAARIMMELHRLNASQVKATGPKGVITKGDVMEAIAGAVPPAPAPAAPKVEEVSKQASPSANVDSNKSLNQVMDDEELPYVDIPTSNIRKVIARRLLESKTTVPHMYVSADIGLDKILSMRKSLAANGVKISVNDCVLRAVALALEQVPSANAFWSEERGKPVQAEAVDVAVAVATKDGLFTPIVKNANKKSLTEISTDVKNLAAKARENKLKPEEFQGGSFSVSNLGMFGVDSFSAIINPPQGGIMAVGGGRKVAKMGSAGTPVVLTEMTVTLSADSRVFDGQTASDFLGAFKANMEDPFRLSIV